MAKSSNREPKKLRMLEGVKWVLGCVRPWCSELLGPLTILGGLAGLVAAYLFVIDWRVDLMVRNPAFISELARRARPALVVDSNGKLVGDSGAMQFLEKVPEVSTVPSGTVTAVRIIITPKNNLTAAPIVEALDESNVSVKADRGIGITWEIIIVSRFLLMGDPGAGPSPDHIQPTRYRLELIPP